MPRLTARRRTAALFSSLAAVIGAVVAVSAAVANTDASSDASSPSTSLIATPLPTSTGTGSSSTGSTSAGSSSTGSSSPSASAPAASASATRTSTAHPSPTATSARPAAGSALALLATLPVRAKATGVAYQRTVDFGAAWIDVDENGCDTRNDILARDLTGEVKSGSCTVLRGTLHDVYTGSTMTFVRGEDTSTLVQIDHLVPLADAWATGAQKLTQAQRIALANDPNNLQAVDGKLNESKGDKDASDWEPPNTAYDCTYVARQIEVKATYHLWVTALERDYMTSTLARCPGQTATKRALAVPAGATAAVARYPGPGVAASAGSSTGAASGSSSGTSSSSGSTSKAPAAAPDAGVVHPGAFCAPAGARGHTSAGTSMVCGTTANSPTRARWHSG
ncbi:HNH endonuclease family protein [Gryllotalpicola ginsengisoli]|uniref:HNH endonuclease family protein n=1 Tax=Gryllotalpicola ginsengisoli TaxID=444608 RepID=UPI0003B722C6|nr:HNH endonuclease family protein [Gryllotalpicola ginsengisoli]